MALGQRRDCLAGDGARLAVGLIQTATQRPARDCCQSLKCPFDNRGYAEKGQALGEEGVHRDLIGGIEHARCGAACEGRLTCEAQARKSVGIDRLKVEPPERDEVKRLDRQLYAAAPCSA